MSFLHIDRIMQFKSFHSKTKTYLFYMVNIMAADVLATKGAWTSATMILTELNRDNLVPAR